MLKTNLLSTLLCKPVNPLFNTRTVQVLLDLKTKDKKVIKTNITIRPVKGMEKVSILYKRNKLGKPTDKGTKSKDDNNIY